MNGADSRQRQSIRPGKGTESIDVVVELTDHLYPISAKVHRRNGAWCATAS